MGIASTLRLMLMLFVSILGLEASAQVSPTGTGALQGTVTDPTGAVIPGAHITATEEFTGKQYHTTIGTSGLYRVLELVAGKYSVRFEARGFRTETKTSVVVSPGKLSQLAVSLAVGSGGGVQVTTMAVGTGAIAGKVVDPTGAAINGVKIKVIDETTEKMNETATDCGGVYRVADLKPGTYTVRFLKKEFRPETRTSVGVLPSQVTQLNSKLQVGAFEDWGPQATAQNVPIETGPTGTIRGTVLGPAGAAIPARITVIEKSSEKYYATTTDSDGTYILRNVPVGSYCLAYDAADWGSGVQDMVSVTSSRTTSADIRVPTQPQTVHVCTASCPIETSESSVPSAHPAITLRVYAENSVAMPGSPLWLTVVLTNTAKHPVFIPTRGAPDASFSYQVYAYGPCGCPGGLPKRELGADSAGDKHFAGKGSNAGAIRVPPGGTLTDKIDLSKLLDLGHARPYGPTYAIHVRSLDPSRIKNGEEPEGQATIRSNVILVTVMAQ